MGVSFADFLTPAGALIAAGILTTLIQILKNALPALDERVSGALMALVLAALLYVATAIAVRPPDADGYLSVFMAWLTCVASAMGIKAGAAHVGELIENR